MKKKEKKLRNSLCTIQILLIWKYIFFTKKINISPESAKKTTNLNVYLFLIQKSSINLLIKHGYICIYIRNSNIHIFTRFLFFRLLLKFATGQVTAGSRSCDVWSRGKVLFFTLNFTQQTVIFLCPEVLKVFMKKAMTASWKRSLVKW